MMLYITYNYSETDDGIESQHENVSIHMDKKNPKKFCQGILESIFHIIFASLTILTLTFFTYLGLYGELNKLTTAAQTVTVSSE